MTRRLMGSEHGERRGKSSYGPLPHGRGSVQPHPSNDVSLGPTKRKPVDALAIRRAAVAPPLRVLPKPFGDWVARPRFARIAQGLRNRCCGVSTELAGLGFGQVALAHLELR